MGDKDTVDKMKPIKRRRIDIGNPFLWKAIYTIIYQGAEEGASREEYILTATPSVEAVIDEILVAVADGPIRIVIKTCEYLGRVLNDSILEDNGIQYKV